MSVSKEIKQIQEQVKQLLIANPMYRDSDKKLSAKIWAIQMGGMENLKKMSAYDFLCEYTQDGNKCKLVSQESIGRARRKLQEEFPILRGKKYKEKQEEQPEVVKALGYGSAKQ